MKKIYYILFFVFGFFPFGISAAPIIINHESVALYDDIPDQYMTTIKQMWFSMPGESHARAYPNGLAALQAQDSNYKIVTSSPGTGNISGDGLNIAGYLWNGSSWESGAGEEDWFYNGATKPQSHIAKVNGASYRSSILGLGWCWDASLTPDDFDDYIAATQEYSDYARSLGSKVKIVFTTGPIDGGGTAARDEKYARVRTHINNSSNEILFDYADILQYNNAGVKLQTTYGTIHSDNDGSTDSHIGTEGELRLAKAAWVLMARVAGWDGTINGVDSTKPNVSAFTVPAIASSLTVSISTFIASDNVGVTGYKLTESSTAPTAGSAGWTALAPTAYTFSSAGNKTLYAWAKDAAGNVSTNRSDSVIITLSNGRGSSIYRFWSNSKQGHFFTQSEAEANNIIANDSSWSYEGVAYNAFTTQEANTTPIYRFWSNSKQHHFFTASAAEKDSIIANDHSWSYEGIAYYAYASQQANTTPVYRFWSQQKQGHFFTISEAEKDSIIANDPSWSYEGIAWYVPTN